MSTVDFASPSFRAASSDLTVSISPLGLVELADEEFEVHGPRLNRYAQNWAFYLGHHWAYRRELGEPQVTFNYVKAFSDYITNFTFSRGVQMRSPKETEAIVPALLQRCWEVDNDKEAILWEMGNQGSVSGDCFVKVAYEEPYYSGMDNSVAPAQPIPGVMQRFYPGKVRILPLNSAHCFPEWHPHDRSRFLRFKLKYRFWGTSAEGTRQVFTYTELITDEWIEEYVNDEMIDQRPNPLGTVPVVHIANTLVSGSPWGLADIADVVPLNRLYNEIATDVADIINYHAAPVTVITGAKAGNLEKGPKKVWGGLPKDAQVFNLELGANLAAPQEFLALIKVAMHEMTGVHETALGQAQPISNTSGVALAIQFQPLMQRYNQKKIQYTLGLQRINELILMTLAIKEPLSLEYDQTLAETPLREGQLPVLDPADPITYQSVIHWPPPLPIDVLVKLQEIQQKMMVGLESKRGALRDLGKENPDATLQEIFEELLEDTEDQGVLDLRRAAYQAAIAELTGMTPDGQMVPPPNDGGVTSAGGANVNGPNGGQQPGIVTQPNTAQSAAQSAIAGMQEGDIQKAITEMVTRAYSPRMSRRNPQKDDD